MTLVSSFVGHVNQRKDKTLDTYLQQGKLLLQAKVPKVIFTDLDMYTHLQPLANDLTHIVLIQKEDGYLYQHQTEITQFSLHTDNPSKDTLEYMFTMCHKTEWIRKAIELNPFQTEQFLWLDFGIRSIFQGDDDTFLQAIEAMCQKTYQQVRIGSIWNLKHDYGVNLYRNITWYFAGGVFGGSQTHLLKFADKTQEQCLQVIREKQTLMWEVNIWYLIYQKDPDLFDVYPCNHDNRLLLHY